MIKFKEAIPSAYRGQTDPYFDAALNSLAKKKAAAGMQDQADYIEGVLAAEKNRVVGRVQSRPGIRLPATAGAAATTAAAAEVAAASPPPQPPPPPPDQPPPPPRPAAYHRSEQEGQKAATAKESSAASTAAAADKDDYDEDQDDKKDPDAVAAAAAPMTALGIARGGPGIHRPLP